MQTPSGFSPLPSSPRSSTGRSTLFTMSPPGAPYRSNSVFPVNHPAALGYLLAPPTTPTVDRACPTQNNQSWDVNNPPTWPILHLPFHMTPGCSRPVHIDELLVHVHYKGIGARLLRELLFRAIEEMKTEEEKVAVERMAFLCWPFNVTANGYWKPGSGMTPEDIEAWKATKAEAWLPLLHPGATTYREVQPAKCDGPDAAQAACDKRLPGSLTSTEGPSVIGGCEHRDH